MACANLQDRCDNLRICDSVVVVFLMCDPVIIHWLLINSILGTVDSLLTDLPLAPRLSTCFYLLPTLFDDQ